MTPGLTKFANDDIVTASLVKMLASQGRVGSFELVSAIVDEVPFMGSPMRDAYEGISVVRGDRGSILSRPKQSTPKPRHSIDAVGALTFGLGGSSEVSVPLSRTIFQNGRPSTLMTSQFDLSNGAPALSKVSEPFAQWISLPPTSLTEPHLHLPLQPVTAPVRVLESFGNILRRVEVGGKSTPASAELEKSIGRIQDAIAQRLPGMRNPFSVWAVINPKPSTPISRRNWSVDQGLDQTEGILTEALRNGGRIFRLRKT